MSTQTPARRTDPSAAPRGTLDDWCPSRRTVMRTLASLGGLTLVPGLLVACSGDDGSGATSDGGSSGSDSSSSSSSSSSSEGSGGSTIAAADVAVGTAVVVQVDGAAYVVAQPAEGEFVAFDARCTHQGTTVGAGEGTTWSARTTAASSTPPTAVRCCRARRPRPSPRSTSRSRATSSCWAEGGSGQGRDEGTRIGPRRVGLQHHGVGPGLRQLPDALGHGVGRHRGRWRSRL